MLFNSLHYYIFLPIVVLLFFTLNSRQKLVLFLASVYFYSALKLAFLPLLYISLGFTHISSLRMEATENHRTRKFWLFLSLFVNLGILTFFKYTDFLRSIYFDISKFFGITSAITTFDPIGLVLPLGISFYTFQAIAYSIDVYRKQIPAEKSFFNFSLFLLFFPQLVAGPIIRAATLIPQFEGLKKFSKENFLAGAEIIAIGIFKKTIIADTLATLIAPVYAAPSNFDGFSNFMAILFFTIQIYCDFAGYSDIAIGTGKILGFDIPINFRRPYLATSATDIWRRWHISLSTWLKDYLYISLGGNRVSKFRNYINLFLTMVLGGVWHGAAWTFVVWGFIHAMFLIIEKFFMEKGWDKFFIGTWKPIKIIYAFSIFSFGALFFRAENMSKAFISLKQIFTFGGGERIPLSFSIFIPIFLLFLFEVIEENYDPIIQNQFYNQYLRRAIVISTFFVAGIIYTVTSSPQFYYFQF